VRNNVLGTRALAKMAAAQKVKRFVNVSTDKAVRPTSMMGASKRVAELVVQDLAGQNTDTKFSIVRFGNVLGSSGSVVPAFRNQIKSGGPVTVTHQNITRYFMTTSEAAELVLTAGAISAGGEVYLLDMGNPVRIFDLAKSMIERSGNRLRSSKQPDGDIEINISGLRPGEKIFEELLIDATAQPTSHPKIFKAQEPYLSEIETARMMQDIEFALKAQDENQLRHVVFGWIAEKETSFENQEFRKAS
ncbi:MAG: polysaccharide biosynthesis protein, partial [Pseudomonadota bacterium]